MIDLLPGRSQVFIYQCVGGTADVIQYIHLLSYFLNKGSFSRSQVSFQYPYGIFYAVTYNFFRYLRQFLNCLAVDFQVMKKLKIISNLGKLLELSSLQVIILRVEKYHGNNLHNNYNYWDKRKTGPP